ncbi:glycosyl transferase [Ramlibacter alkalitolerans]|uniref:Glycosyl transferase n=1 Tax=Ramlibacter alkalitolerans TaxID=2039631 RepID=A0ABS1JP84_9BURK|nr:glycosyl transferase [Ramlibacter alkalitolerans]MBL0426074.1 glycosyl transferase [Ramlibacter alkalitolerans]
MLKPLRDGLRRHAAFTICARNYFAQALLLHRSFTAQHPDADFHVVLVDRRDDAFAARYPGVSITWVEDIGLPDFAAHALRFDVIELSTNVKPHCLLLLLEAYETAIYVDPDMVAYDHLSPVYEALVDGTIVVTPASTTPILDGHRPDDIEFLRVGNFNLGFIAVKRCDEARRFLRWWSDRCLSDGFHETQSGVFVDQKWVNLAPCYFDGCRILKDPGINMAQWNLHERTLSVVDGRYLVNGTAPLRLFHFSSFDPHRPQSIAKRQARFPEGSRADLAPLLEDYARELLAAGFEALSRIEYGFDYFPSGEYVSPTLRRIYANPAYGFPLAEDPFQPDSALVRFARSKRLMGPRVRKAPRATGADLSRHGLQIRILSYGFRFALWVLGPNRYFLLMRYLAHASSIRNQPPL